jgi:hypothetical protein
MNKPIIIKGYITSHTNTNVILVLDYYYCRQKLNKELNKLHFGRHEFGDLAL